MSNARFMLSGPSLSPQDATHALICLHGFGADGQDFITLAPPLHNLLQAAGKNGEKTINLAVFCPNAPTPTPFAQGFQWFRDMGWTFRDPAGQADSHTHLENYLDNITETTGIPRQNMVLLGFSQGGMQALYTVPRLSSPVGGLITIATMLADHTVPATITPCPVLMLHGTADDVLPADTTVTAATKLEEWGYQPEVHLLPNLGHGFDNRCLAHIGVFLTNLWES